MKPDSWREVWRQKDTPLKVAYEKIAHIRKEYFGRDYDKSFWYRRGNAFVEYAEAWERLSQVEPSETSDLLQEALVAYNDAQESYERIKDMDSAASVCCRRAQIAESLYPDNFSGVEELYKRAVNLASNSKPYYQTELDAFRGRKRKTS